MKRKRFAWTSVLSGLFLALAILPGTLQAEETLKIGIIYYFGDRTGEGIRRGAELAAEEINSSGGILGKPVQLIFSDDKFRPDIGAYEYTKLVREDNVAAVIGTTSTEITLAVMEQMAKYKVPFLSTSSASLKGPGLVRQNYGKYKYFFRVHYGSDEIAEINNDWVLHLVKTRKMKKVALMIENAAWTKPIAETLEKRLRDAGVEIPVFEYFYKEARDFTPTLTKVRTSKADMLFFLSAHVDAGAFLTQWADMKGPILTGIVIGYTTLWKASEGKVLSMSMMSAPGILGLTQRDRAFCENYQKKFNAGTEYTSPNTYDAMYIVKHAIERARTTESEDVTDSLGKTDYEGVLGRWVFEKSHNSKHGPGYREMIVIQWQKDGKICVVSPESLKNCDFILPPWYEEKKK